MHFQETNPLRSLMQTPLPTITEQRRRLYRPDIGEIYAVYDLLNEMVFNNALTRPKITTRNTRKFLGHCIGSNERGTFEMILNDRWMCVQLMVVTLAHEMVHQYQWVVIGDHQVARGKRRFMGHNSSFYQYRHTLSQFGIMLKRHFNSDRWIRYQDFTRC